MKAPVDHWEELVKAIEWGVSLDMLKRLAELQRIERMHLKQMDVTWLHEDKDDTKTLGSV